MLFVVIVAIALAAAAVILIGSDVVVVAPLSATAAVLITTDAVVAADITTIAAATNAAAAAAITTIAATANTDATSATAFAATASVVFQYHHKKIPRRSQCFSPPSLRLCQLLSLPLLLHEWQPPLRRHPVGVPAVHVLHPGHGHGGAKLVRALERQGRVDNVEPREERGHLGQGIVVGAVDP